MNKSIQKSILALAVIISTGACAWAQDGTKPTPFPADPSAFPGKGAVRVHPWMIDNRNYYWTKRADAQGAVVFVGDSLIGNWKTVAAAFPNMKVANRGIGGDVTRNLLFRFKEDVLDLHPKAIVMCVGTNDLSCREDTDDAISNLTDLLDLAAKQDPAMPVIMCNVPPRDDPKSQIDSSELLKLNQKIEALAKSRSNVTFIDLYKPMATPEGKPVEQYFRPDKIHPVQTGYDVWAGLLKPVFAKLKLETQG